MTKHGDQVRDRMVRAIRSYQALHGYPPSIRDLGRYTGHSSPATVHHHLQQLEAEGRVTWRGGRQRTLRVID